MRGVDTRWKVPGGGEVACRLEPLPRYVSKESTFTVSDHYMFGSISHSSLVYAE